MADSVVRKACDRCHLQKLSCKRDADEACERCIRQHAECKSSPSLRYKKRQHLPQRRPRSEQQQQQQTEQKEQKEQEQPKQPKQQKQQKEQKQGRQPPPPSPPPQKQLEKQARPQPPQPDQRQPPSAGDQAALAERRTQKRRRTGSEVKRVQPQTGETDAPIPSPGEFTTTNDLAVASDASLDLERFIFNFGQSLYSSEPPDPLSGLHATTDPFSSPSSLSDPWPQQLAASLEGYQPASLSSFAAGVGNRFHPVGPAIALGDPLCAAGNEATDGRRQRRSRPRPRQIELRAIAPNPEHEARNKGLDWMAQLSNINARLLSLASILTQQPGRPVAEGHEFPIDEMYDLSGDVAKILERLSKGDFNKDTYLNGTDPGNSMFVLAVYVRLLDLYQKVFSLLRAELPQAKSGLRFKFWKLPDVTVGTFTVDSMPTLQLSLTVQLGEELLARLRESVGKLLPGIRDDGDGLNCESLFSDVVHLSSRAMKTKGDSVAKYLADFRGEIEEALAA